MDWTSNALLSTALALSRAHARAKPGGRALPPLLFLTDPERTPEPWRVAERLPQGAGVVFRAFGAADAVKVGERLLEIARRRGLTLLVGSDADLAEIIGADGVHLPERDLERAAELRSRRPDWRLTGAAHSEAALERAAQAGLDAALLSPVFDSASPSAGRPLGVDAFARMVAAARLPIYPLGGVSADTAPRLAGSGACGLAVVSALTDA